MNKNALIIFMKNPVKGKVKTRLAKSIGEDNALEIYRKLLRRSLEITSVSSAERWLYYSDCIDSHDEWPGNFFSKKLQEGSDLGERMLHAFQTAFDAAKEKVVIIGTDCFDLKPEILQAAFDALDKNDVVIGPAFDGGYYLLGMKAFYPQLFHDKSWSTAKVFQQTMESIETLNLSAKRLDSLYDIDTVNDLKKHPELANYINHSAI